jgi:hypothetical protein
MRPFRALLNLLHRHRLTDHKTFLSARQSEVRFDGDRHQFITGWIKSYLEGDKVLNRFLNHDDHHYNLDVVLNMVSHKGDFALRAHVAIYEEQRFTHTLSLIDVDQKYYAKLHKGGHLRYQMAGGQVRPLSKRTSTQVLFGKKPKLIYLATYPLPAEFT